MKKIIILIMSFFLAISICACTKSLHNASVSSNSAENKNTNAYVPTDNTDVNELDVLEITDLSNGILTGDFIAIEQIHYLENTKEIFSLVSSKDLSKIVCTKIADNITTDIMNKQEIQRFDCFDDAVFAFGDQQITKHDTVTAVKDDFAIKNESIRLINSCISIDQNNIIYFDDNNIFLTQLSKPETTQKIPVTQDGRILTVSPVTHDLYFATVLGKDGQNSVVIVDNMGNTLFCDKYSSVYPAHYDTGVLLHQGQESNVSNELYIIDVMRKDVLEILTVDKAETNAANISKNGEWILTALYDEVTGRVIVRLYNVTQEKYSEYEIPSSYVTGTANILGASNSLFISNDGIWGGIRILDDIGYKLLRLKFPSAHRGKLSFEVNQRDSIAALQK